MKKKDMCYKSIDSLQEVKRVLDAVCEAINDKSKNILNAPLPNFVGGVCGGGVGSIATGSLIYHLGRTGLSAPGIASGLKALGFGAGMMAGVGVATGIVAVSAVGGYALSNRAKTKKLRKEKMRLYIDAISKQNAIIKELENEVSGMKERIEYLEKLNILLENVIANLTHDLEVEV